MPPTPLRSFWPRSFRAQLAASFGLLGALLAVVLATTLGARLASDSERSEGADLGSVAEVVSRMLSDGLNERTREIQVMAESPTLWRDGLASEHVRQVFFRSQALNPHSVWIGVADARGRIVTDSGRMLEGSDATDLPWFSPGTRSMHVGDVRQAKMLARMLPRAFDGGAQRFVDFAAPIRAQGELLGVVALQVSWDWAHAAVSSLQPGDAARRGLEVFIFDRRGQPIYAVADKLDGLLAAGQRLPLAQRAGGAPFAAVLEWNDGHRYLTAAAPMKPRSPAADLGWTVVVREPIDSALASARQAASLALLMGLVTTAMFAAVGWWLAKQLTLPLKRLAELALAVERMPADAEMPLLTGSVEVENLSQALAGMTHRLRAANASLEQRVLERTKALEHANAELSQLARIDPLTGLLNRRGLDDRLALARASARRDGSPVAVVAIDVDHFKSINDRFGHDAGDDVLRRLADALRQRLREADIVARAGGEEFVAILPDTGLAGGCQVAASLIERLGAMSFPVVGQLTISCGVAEWRIGNEPAREALARADGALYRAKHSGRNRYCVADAAPERLVSTA